MGREHTALSHACLDLKHHVTVTDTAGKTIIVALDDVRDAAWYSISLENLPQRVPVYTIKGFPEVDEVDIKSSLPLSTLLNDIT